MKSNSLLIIFIALSGVQFLPFDSFAQNKPKNDKTAFVKTMFGHKDTIERTDILTIYPTNFVAYTAKLGYEFKIAHNKGLKITASYGSSNGTDDFYYLDKFNEIGMEAQLRIYLLKGHPALNGLYLAPYVSYKTMNYSGTAYANYIDLLYPAPPQLYYSNVNVSNFGIGYVIGYQWIFSSTFTVDAFIGGGNNSISGNNAGGNLSNTIYEYRSGIDLHSGIAIGIAF